MKNALRTHIGWVRQVNEDSGSILHLDEQTVLAIIADGMGGHNAGDVASKMAIEIIQSEISARWKDQTWEELLLEAVRQANRQIYEQSRANLHLEGMGTTVEVGLLSPYKGLIAHVGDSRVYLYQKPVLRQITEDHSLVYELYKKGQITSEEAANHPQKNMILRALGTEPDIEIDLIPFTWKEGDRLFICTDGFSNYVDHDRLLHYLEKPVPIHELSDDLLQIALELGGDDNITLIVVENSLCAEEGGDGSCR